MADRGRDTSYELTEVRTVLSRAETAYKLIEDHPNTWAGRYYGVDPERESMLSALADVVDRLSPWRRTGRGKA